MKQREIWYADLNPAEGKEQRGKRPVVVISGNAMNDNLEILIVCPLTSVIKHFSGCLVLEANNMNNLSEDSEVLTFQIRTISKRRLLHKIGEITRDQLEIIKDGLTDILKY